MEAEKAVFLWDSAHHTIMADLKRIGIPPTLLTRPLTEALRHAAQYDLVEEPRPSLARKLHMQELSAALISPLDYAKESSDYLIVPGIAVSSFHGNGSVMVRFRDGVQNITTLAVDPAFASEIVMTKIVLAEEFAVEPAIFPMNASLDVMLQKADAALMTGDEAFRLRHESENMIDIVEEWSEMTDLPFVHAIWCCRAGDLNPADVESLQQMQTKGTHGIAEIARTYPPEQREAITDHLNSFSYALDDEVRDALAETMKYLYYHGVLPDVAELNFYRFEDTTEAGDGGTISPN